MYIYNADLYCDDCGMNIIDKLTIKDSGDSDDYPQYVDEDYSETDSPNHCGNGPDCLAAETYDGRKVGAYLNQCLTSEGQSYALSEFIESPNQLTLTWIERAGIEEEAAEALFDSIWNQIKAGTYNQ